MKTSVTIVDYEVGNLFGLRGAMSCLGAETVMADNVEAILSADRLLLPGVGAFGNSIDGVREKGFDEAIGQFVNTGRPLLGICLGMQLLFSESEEFGHHKGLGLVPGRVTAIASAGVDGTPHCIPHVGWSAIMPPSEARWEGTIFEESEVGVDVYFAHSFTGHPEQSRHCLALADYNGHTITAAVQAENVMGCQFHPEKSGPIGLTIINAFLNI